MKTPLNQPDDLRHDPREDDLDEAIRALFAECPNLCGFTVRDAASLGAAANILTLDTDVVVSDVAVYPVQSFNESSEVHSAIASALVDLIERSPDTRGLLGGRTFARTLQ